MSHLPVRAKLKLPKYQSCRPAVDNVARKHLRSSPKTVQLPPLQDGKRRHSGTSMSSRATSYDKQQAAQTFATMKNVNGTELVKEEVTLLTDYLDTEEDALGRLSTELQRESNTDDKWAKIEGIMLSLEQRSQSEDNKELSQDEMLSLLQTRPWRMTFFTKIKPHKRESVPVPEDLCISQEDGVRIVTQFGKNFSVTFSAPFRWDGGNRVLNLDFNQIQVQLFGSKVQLPLLWKPAGEVPRALRFFWLEKEQGFAMARMDTGGLIFFRGV